MLKEHEEAFHAAADACSCWIGLREPNAHAEEWIGAPDAVPKGVDCAAKTANNPGCPFAGLVMDPTLKGYPRGQEPFVPGSDSERAALHKWEKFAPGGRLPDGFTRDTAGPDMGLVRHGKAAIFADYDLMSVIPCDEFGTVIHPPLDKSFQVIDELYVKVRDYLEVNLGLPFSMIQHGPEFLYEGVGSVPEETVIWFLPGGRKIYGKGLSDQRNSAFQ